MADRSKIEMSNMIAPKKPAYSIEYKTDNWPSGLKDAETAANELSIPVERLTALADAGYAPHYRIDGGAPLFRIAELKRWAANNLLTSHDGRDFPNGPVQVVLSLPRADPKRVPSPLRQISSLCEITNEILRSGIYFLCEGDQVLYVGQSINVHARLGTHALQKKFSSAFYLPWPPDDLLALEGALIRSLRPPLNGPSAGGRERDSDKETLSAIMTGTE